MRGPVAKDPRGVRSAAFQRETLWPEEICHQHSLAIECGRTGPFNPLPVRVARTAPVEARTTETESEMLLGTQIFVPSKIGNLWHGADCDGLQDGACEIRASEASRLKSVTQMFAPS